MKIVILGGGNGGSISIRALKPYTERLTLTAIIGMSDSGGSSGRLREEFGVLPPGDILRAVLATSQYDYDLLKRIFYEKRFTNSGKLTDHGLGHLFLALAARYTGGSGTDRGLIDAIHALSQAVDSVGAVYPVTIEPSDLCVEVSNGEIIVGEHEIDRPAYDRALTIRRAWLQPTPHIYEVAKQAILNADAIIIGPGSFYTSLIATLLPEGVKDAIRESSAKLIYVAGNGIEKNGETGPTRLSDCVQTLETYLPRPLDVIAYNSAVLDVTQKAYYDKKGWTEIIGDVDTVAGKTVIAQPFELPGGGLDPEKLGKLLTPLFA